MTRTHDLYRMFDRAGRLLYIGISFNAGERATQHAEGKPWWPQVDHIRIEHLECSREDALRKERWAIVAERPLHNIQHNRHRNEYSPRGASVVPFSTPYVVSRSDEWRDLKRAAHAFLTGITTEREEHENLASARRLLAGPTPAALDFYNLDVVGLITAMVMACHYAAPCDACGDMLVPDAVCSRPGDVDHLTIIARCTTCSTEAQTQLIDIKEAA